MGLQEIRLEVYSELERPEHPIESNGKNLCELVQKNELENLNELKNICTSIGLPTHGHKNRKTTFAAPIKELVGKCSCIS